MFRYRRDFLLKGRLWLFFLCGATAVLGHEDLARQIRDVTERLVDEPGNASLLLRRAELYIRHHDWELARADLAAAEQRDPENAAVVLFLARVDLGENRPEACLKRLDALIAERPRQPAPHFYRGRALLLQGKSREAAEAFGRGIEHLTEPRPEHYLERAKALASDPGAVIPAIESLDEGLRRLPGNISLEYRALQLERLAGLWSEAVARIERVRSVHGELPLWLVIKGETLVDAGHRREAWTTLKQALRAIDRMPARRKAAPAMKALAQRARERLASLGKEHRSSEP